jgi:uncharacterized membrane protein YkvA (DUF1232 family)
LPYGDLIAALRARAEDMKRDLLVLYYAYRNPRLPLLSRALVIATVAYALSPIDLIPDFIPVLGYLDDLILVPVLIRASVRSIPAGIMEEARRSAAENPIRLRSNRGFAVFVVLVWLAILAWILSLIF